MDTKLVVSSSPHIRSGLTTQKIMLNVLIAMLPALGVSIYVFGINVLWITLICIISCVLTESVIEFLTKRKNTIYDLSACVTGALLAFNLPIKAPWWLCVVGSVFAIGIAKQAFGGLGNNFINPALAGRAFLLASWPIRMTGTAFIPVDVTTQATPLGIIKEGLNVPLPSNMDLFLGFPGVYGAIGEISALALIIGGVYLILRGIISWRIPVVYIATVFVIAMLFGEDPVFQILAGGLMLGAFFMATDYVSSPSTPLGQIIFAFGCGLITMIIRKFGGYPEGVSYSILLMNCAAPLIQKYTEPRVFGKKKVQKAEEANG